MGEKKVTHLDALDLFFYGNREEGVVPRGWAPVLKVLVRMGIPVWDYRGTRELVVAGGGSPLYPADRPSGWQHVTPSPCRVRRRGGPLPRTAQGEALAPLEGLKKQGLARQPSCVLVPSDSW